MSTHYQIGYFGPAAGEPVVNLPGGVQLVGMPRIDVVWVSAPWHAMRQGVRRCSSEQQSEASSPQSAEPVQGAPSEEGE
jgi:hypothetical protein